MPSFGSTGVSANIGLVGLGAVDWPGGPSEGLQDELTRGVEGHVVSADDQERLMPTPATLTSLAQYSSLTRRCAEKVHLSYRQIPRDLAKTTADFIERSRLDDSALKTGFEHITRLLALCSFDGSANSYYEYLAYQVLESIYADGSHSLFDAYLQVLNSRPSLEGLTRFAKKLGIDDSIRLAAGDPNVEGLLAAAVRRPEIAESASAILERAAHVELPSMYLRRLDHLLESPANDHKLEELLDWNDQSARHGFARHPRVLAAISRVEHALGNNRDSREAEVVFYERVIAQDLLQRPKDGWQMEWVISLLECTDHPLAQQMVEDLRREDGDLDLHFNNAETMDRLTSQTTATQRVEDSAACAVLCKKPNGRWGISLLDPFCETERLTLRAIRDVLLSLLHEYTHRVQVRELSEECLESDRINMEWEALLLELEISILTGDRTLLECMSKISPYGAIMGARISTEQQHLRRYNLPETFVSTK